MDAVRYLKERERRCDSFDDHCTGCEIKSAKNGMTCGAYIKKHPEQAVAIVEKWAKEHPRKTLLQDFLEKYPKAPIEDGAVPAVCPFQLGYETESEKDKNGYCESAGKDSCRKCWNRPLEEK